MEALERDEKFGYILCVRYPKKKYYYSYRLSLRVSSNVLYVKGYFMWYDIILVTIHLRWILIFTVHYMFFCLNCCTYAVCVGNCTYHYHVIFLLYLFSTNVFSLLMYVTGGVPVFLLSKHAWVCFVISNSCGWCVLPLASSSFGFHALRARKWRDNTNILGASYDISLYPAEIANIVKEGVWWIPRHIIVWWRVTISTGDNIQQNLRQTWEVKNGTKKNWKYQVEIQKRKHRIQEKRDDTVASQLFKSSVCSNECSCLTGLSLYLLISKIDSRFSTFRYLRIFGCNLMLDVMCKSKYWSSC